MRRFGGMCPICLTLFIIRVTRQARALRVSDLSVWSGVWESIETARISLFAQNRDLNVVVPEVFQIVSSLPTKAVSFLCAARNRVR